jgi:hypothetical protein
MLKLHFQSATVRTTGAFSGAFLHGIPLRCMRSLRGRADSCEAALQTRAGRSIRGRGSVMEPGLSGLKTSIRTCMSDTVANESIISRLIVFRQTIVVLLA